MSGRLSKEVIPSECSFYKTLSLQLCRILEDIGVSTACRDISVKASTTAEILWSVFTSIMTNIDCSCHFVGSSFEGTTTHGLKSDIDIVVPILPFTIVTNIAEAQQYMFCLLLVQDAYTPAGYCKLQIVVPDTPLDEERIFFSPSFLSPGLKLHGPAHTLTLNNFVADIVPAVKSSLWPDCASEWLVRERHYNWPSQEQIDKCKTLGCFFARVGHPKSNEKDLQWRLSFSLQERLLVTDFNSVQLKCYILLKIIKKEKIHKRLGEKSLTSYHFKTCMLYMIENTPAEFWSDENLLFCLQHCLYQMLVWVETGVCPNYFIPEENMFDGRVSRRMQIRICDILRILLSADFKFLLALKTDMLAIRLQEALELGINAPGNGQNNRVHLIKSCSNVYSCLMFLRGVFFNQCQNTTSQVFVQEVCKVQQRFLRTNTLSEHSVTEIQEAFSLVLPYMDLTMMSLQTVEAKRKSASNEMISSLLTNERWHAVSLEMDPFSAKLKQASAMCMLAYCDLSLAVLLGLQDRIEGQKSVCGCPGTPILTQASFENLLPIVSECSYDELLHRHFIPSVVYLPAERELTPPALCYEMDRSVASPTENKWYWYDCAVVDGKILFYFLLYLNHHHLGMEENALADVESLSRLIANDDQLSHPETALNILGWIYKERGLTALAQMYFAISLALRPSHNAASLHLKEISSIFASHQQR